MLNVVRTLFIFPASQVRRFYKNCCEENTTLLGRNVSRKVTNCSDKMNDVFRSSYVFEFQNEFKCVTV